MLRLENVRNEKKLTKIQVSKMLNVSDVTYGKWEHEFEQIPTRRLFQFANLFEINIDYLVGLSNIKIPKKGNYLLNLKEIGQHIRELRLELNMTLREIAKLLAISNSTWSEYETGTYLIQSTYLIIICKKTGISADYILGRSKVKYLKDLL